MANIIFTNAEQYAQVHEAFRLDNLNALAVEHGLQIYATTIDYGRYPEYSNVTYAESADFGAMGISFAEHFLEFCRLHKPEKIINYIDYLTPWDNVIYDAEMIWFVRSLYAEVISKNPNQDKLDKWINREKIGIAAADKVICASPTSQEAISRHYDINAEVVLEYVNPTKFLELPAPSVFKKEAYFTGRFDNQKRFSMIKPPSDWNVLGVGGSALDVDNIDSNVTLLGLLPFEDYKEKISSAVFGLYPAIWESNGFGVQECLAMGKIPIIHTGSCGHERLCDKTNSISIDWTSDNWSEIAESSYDTSMHDAAKNTLTEKMYEESKDKFLNVIL